MEAYETRVHESYKLNNFPHCYCEQVSTRGIFPMNHVVKIKYTLGRVLVTVVDSCSSQMRHFVDVELWCLKNTAWNFSYELCCENKIHFPDRRNCKNMDTCSMRPLLFHYFANKKCKFGITVCANKTANAVQMSIISAHFVGICPPPSFDIIDKKI